MNLLESQQIEISVSEAKDLVKEIWLVISRPVNPKNKLELLEIFAFPYLRGVGLKLARRAIRAKPGATFHITLTAQELLAIHQLINKFPITLYNIMGTIDRKVLNYDQQINM